MTPFREISHEPGETLDPRRLLRHYFLRCAMAKLLPETPREFRCVVKNGHLVQWGSCPEISSITASSLFLAFQAGQGPEFIDQHDCPYFEAHLQRVYRWLR